jgi:hypothetical protein
MNSKQLSGLIQGVLTPNGLYVPGVETLLLGTAAQESHMGYYSKQINGPALGMFQMEPDTNKDRWERYINNRPILKKIFGDYHYYGPSDTALQYDKVYQILMARIKYLPVKEAIPRSIEGQAHYWKDHWNTHLGKGTVEEYLKNYKKYVGEVLS